jgi:hypothetical protein
MEILKTLVGVLIIISSFTNSAQDWSSNNSIKIPLSRPNNPGKLIFHQVSGSINVEGYNGTEVIVEATISDKISFTTSKNELNKIIETSTNIIIEERDNVVRIINKQEHKTVNLEIKVPENFSLDLHTIKNGDISVKGVTGEMEISHVDGNITMNEISGAVSANTTNGDLRIRLVKVPDDAGMAFSSFNGKVDITFPNTLKANVQIKSDFGNISTDFDIEIENQEVEISSDNPDGVHKIRLNREWLMGKINGGGGEMYFQTYKGDIVIRSN